MFFNDYTSLSGSAGCMRLLRGWTLAFAWSIDKPFSYRTCWFCVQASKEDFWRWFISVFKSHASDPGASGETVELYQQAKMLWVQAHQTITITIRNSDPAALQYFMQCCRISKQKYILFIDQSYWNQSIILLSCPLRWASIKF